jgi:hypothetical protein
VCIAEAVAKAVDREAEGAEAVAGLAVFALEVVRVDADAREGHVHDVCA